MNLPDSNFYHNLQNYPTLKSFLAGSASSSFTTIMLQPLDLIKTRMQASSLSNTHNPRMFLCIINIVRTESIFKLWRGTVPSLMRSVPGVGLYFSSLEFINNSLYQSDKIKISPFQAFCSGFIARCFAGTILLPFTVIKTRFESKKYSYKSVLDAICSISTQEGIKGLYTGLVPTLIRDAPFSGIYYMFYSQLKYNLNETFQNEIIFKFKWIIPFFCGITSGALATIITHPADVIKTQVQLTSPKFAKIIPICKLILKQKNIFGFFVGLTPRLIRRTLMASLTWTYFELLMKISPE